MKFDARLTLIQKSQGYPFISFKPIKRMQKQILSFVLLIFVFTIFAFAPSAFADQSVSIAQGASSGGSAPCVAANNCFTPNPVNVSPGEKVTWTNTDSVSHTVTSGKPSDIPSGTIFDSGLLAPGKIFSHTFTIADVGTINYFCQIHPWMAGQVIVASASIPEFPMTFSLPILFVIVAISYFVIRQKINVGSKDSLF
jgi:plastocyanin